MITYTDLTQEEKNLFNQIDSIIENKQIFVKVAYALINKYKLNEVLK